MYDDTVMPKCNCDITDKCRADNTCSCADYCRVHERTVAQYRNRQCVTVSPNIKDYESFDKLLVEWHDNFYKLKKHLIGGVIVLEMAGLRPHYHCIFDVRDNVYFTKTLFCWSKYHNVKKHNMFKNGLHYIFKDIAATIRDTGADPIYTYEQMMAEQSEAKRQSLLKKISITKDNLAFHQKELPEWLRALEKE